MACSDRTHSLLTVVAQSANFKIGTLLQDPKMHSLVVEVVPKNKPISYVNLVRMQIDHRSHKVRYSDDA